MLRFRTLFALFLLVFVVGFSDDRCSVAVSDEGPGASGQGDSSWAS